MGAWTQRLVMLAVCLAGAVGVRTLLAQENGQTKLNCDTGP